MKILKHKKLLKDIGTSLLITIAVILALYTLWFIFMQVSQMPMAYFLKYSGGKGATSCSWYCMMAFGGVKCCEFFDVIFEYLFIGHLGFFYYFSNYLILFFLIIFLITLLIKREKSKSL